jgi:hypothetical protein
MPYKENGLSSACLTALFLMGNTIISFPFKNGAASSASEFAAGLLIYLLLSPLIYKLILKIPKSQTKRKILYPLYILFILLALLNGISALLDYGAFLNEVMLKNISLPFAVILFLIPVIFIALQNDRVILKFCLFSFAISVVLIGIFIFITLPEYRFNLRELIFPKDLSSFISGSLYYLAVIAFSAVSVGIYLHLITENGFKRAYLSGIASGGILTLLCLLNSLFVLGIAADNNSFPYSAAISTVTVGDFFTRMDGFSYFLFFMTAITKAGVSALIIKKSLRIMISNRR